MKDVAFPSQAQVRSAAAAGFGPLGSDPPMTLPLHPRWRRFADYVDSLTGHYRKQVRAVREAARHVVRRSLSADEIRSRAAELDALYAQVTSRARLLPSALGARGFAALKAELAGAFELIGYFDDHRLVAFNTRLHLGDTLI